VAELLDFLDAKLGKICQSGLIFNSPFYKNVHYPHTALLNVLAKVDKKPLPFNTNVASPQIRNDQDVVKQKSEMISIYRI
jgi:hypothetical protein